MTKAKIRKKLEKIRSDIEALQQEEKLLMQEEKAVEDAEKLKIIQKSNISSEQLIFLSRLKQDEIETIMNKRKEAGEVAKSDKEKKKATDNVIG